MMVGCSREIGRAEARLSDERHYLSEGCMARLKPTSDTGGIVAIDSGE
jgi:hypothetical protein